MPDKRNELKEPTPEELEEMFEEGEDEQIPFEEEELPEAAKHEPVLVKMKPVYNFQSAEFETVIDFDDPDSVDEAFAKYNQCLTKLMQLAPDQPKLVDAKPKEELATPKQIEIMKKYGIKYTSTTTKKQAREMITKNMEG